MMMERMAGDFFLGDLEAGDEIDFRMTLTYPLVSDGLDIGTSAGHDLSYKLDDTTIVIKPLES
ncbi:Hypothetical protein POVR1_LOCUS562 [uncultured virus]|nr:Hypothetical protein POVR1_LOCUS562 [uncultured virus]